MQTLYTSIVYTYTYICTIYRLYRDISIVLLCYFVPCSLHAYCCWAMRFSSNSAKFHMSEFIDFELLPFCGIWRIFICIWKFGWNIVWSHTYIHTVIYILKYILYICIYVWKFVKYVHTSKFAICIIIIFAWKPRTYRRNLTN